MRLAAPLLALGAGACGGEAHAPFEASLEPTLFVEEPGELVAGSPEWPAAAFDGWSSEPSSALAWALVRESRVRLAATAAAPRTLVLELVGPALETGSQEVRVWLNEQELGRLELGAEPARHTLAAPAEAWVAGANVLRFAAARAGQGPSGKTAYFGLRRIEYSRERRRITRAGGAYLLPSDCGLGFELEVPVPTELALELVAEGPGELELCVEERPVDSAAVAAPRTSRLPVAPGAARPVFTLVPSAAPLEVSLTWRSTGGALRIEALRRRETQPFRRPSVLFLSIDTLSAQHLSLHGYARDTTPELVRRAQDFVVFERARANAPWTIPSYMSQFTGLLPGAHMLAPPEDPSVAPETWELHQLAPNRTTLAEFFRGLGYRTAAFVDNPWLGRGFGFEQGFELLDKAAAEIPLENPAGGLRFTVPRALAWIDGLGAAEPFFLFVQAFDPHAPYTTSAPWAGEFKDDELARAGGEVPIGRGVAFSYGCIPEHVALPFAAGELPAAMATAPLVAAYDEKILEVDAALGELFRRLEERGLLDELVIVISADHGESTTGHDFYFNHALLYGDTLHVPLLLRLPGGEGAGRRVGELVQLVDLFPTLVELVRGAPRAGFHGESLVPLLRAGRATRGVAYSEWGMMEQAALEHGGWKLIASRPRFARYQTQVTSPRLDRAALGALVPELAQGFPDDATVARALAGRPEALALLEGLAGPFFELYELAADPLEQNDLAAREPARVQQLLAELLEWRRRAELARAEASFVGASHAQSEADLDEIERLGYGGK